MWAARAIFWAVSSALRSPGNSSSLILDDDPDDTHLGQRGWLRSDGKSREGQNQDSGNETDILESSAQSYEAQVLKTDVRNQKENLENGKIATEAPGEPRELLENLEGVVTLISTSMNIGLIDYEYEFSLRDVDPRLTRKTRVTFDAEFDPQTANWYAKNIKLAAAEKKPEDDLTRGRLVTNKLPGNGSVMPISLGDRVRCNKNKDFPSDQGFGRERWEDPPYDLEPSSHSNFKHKTHPLSYDDDDDGVESLGVNNPDVDDWIDLTVANAQEEKLRILFQNKFNIRIEPQKSLRFENVKIGERLSKQIEIVNFGAADAILENVQFVDAQDVCSFEIEEHKGQRANDLNLTVITPHCPFRMKIECTSRQVGRTTTLLIFNFGHFQIARWLSIKADSPDAKKIEEITKAETINGDFTFMERKQKKIEIVNEMINNRSKGEGSIPAPLAVRPAFFTPHQIGNYPVSQELMACFRDRDETKLQELCSSIGKKLSPSNYVERFQNSLWFEEIQNEVARREFDLQDAVFIRDPDDSFILDVPRLKEIHPQIIVGEQVRVLQPGMQDTNGVISKIICPSDNCPKVQVRFAEEFNRMYQGTSVKVQFLMGRTCYRRMHFGVKRAMDYLGRDWLFPDADKLVLAQPRIRFFEDERDNLHSNLNKVELEPCLREVRKSDFNSVIKDGEGRRARSLNQVQGNVQEPSGLEEAQLKWFNHKLNEEQRMAVRGILRGQGRPLPYIIFGPPGTGKTVTVVEAVLQVHFLEDTSRILVTAPSNAAVDLIAEHLVATNRFKPGEFVRLNGFIRSEISPLESIGKFCKNGESLDECVLQDRLVICTVSTAGQFFALNPDTRHFSHVFVDEAGYCTEPETMIPCVLAALHKQGQVILAGDPEQLGPVLMCDVEVTMKVLERSFLERLMKSKIYSRNEQDFPETKYNPAVLTKLVRSYRAHPLLLKLPSEMFYSNELVSSAAREDVYDLSESLPHHKRGVPLVFHGVRGDSKKDPGSTSWFNLEEVHQVVFYVRQLRAHGLSFDDIGIISPYRKQVEKIRKTISYYLKNTDNLPKVASVEEFQGGERKVIIISTVRSHSDDIIARKLSRLDFLYSKKRFNVATTRAKALMIVIGNPEVLYLNQYWRKLLDYSIELGVYKGCSLPHPLDSRLNQSVDSFHCLSSPAPFSGCIDDWDEDGFNAMADPRSRFD